jgi:bisphosphoglycerate-independent phosphoglycerate mutase (AlkP superfamily)
MKAAEIAKAAQQALLSGEFDYVRVNFANGDMVGHTGDLEATKLACESVDQGVKVSSFVSPTHPMALKSLGAVALVALSRASIL